MMRKNNARLHGSGLLCTRRTEILKGSSNYMGNLYPPTKEQCLCYVLTL